MAMKEFDFEKEPIVAIVKKIIADALKMKATDIHFDPREKDLVIKFRIDGDLNEYSIVPESAKVNITTRIKILANMNITEALMPQIGTITINSDSNSQNMRVTTLPVINGEKVVIHISNYASKIKTLNKIGFKEEDINKIKDLLKERNGLVLITGGDASGKTTTLYSLLKELNTSADNIISIENPVKMKIEGINQVELNPNRGMTLQNVLKNILLQDPNIIAINELYDEDSIREALRLAVTGKLVLSTMHTKSIYQTIDSLLNMDVENYLLGSNLSGIISQRMVKRLCPSCKTKKPISKYEKTLIKRITGEDIDELYYPEGCEDCRKGYLKQIPIAEVIKIDDELKYAITNNKNRDLIKSIIYEENNSILKNGFEKVIKGETSFEEIMRIIDIRVDINNNDTNLKNLILGNISEDELDNIAITIEDENIEEEEETPIETKKKAKKTPPKEEIENDDDLVEDYEEENEESEYVEEDTEVSEEVTEETEEDEEEYSETEEQENEEVNEESEEYTEEEAGESDNEEDVEPVEKTEAEEESSDENDLSLNLNPVGEDTASEISSNEINNLLSDTNIETEAPSNELNLDLNYDDDDDDDDDFNYGDKYINNF